MKRTTRSLKRGLITRLAGKTLKASGRATNAAGTAAFRTITDAGLRNSRTSWLALGVVVLWGLLAASFVVRELLGGLFQGYGFLAHVFPWLFALVVAFGTVRSYTIIRGRDFHIERAVPFILPTLRSWRGYAAMGLIIVAFVLSLIDGAWQLGILCTVAIAGTAVLGRASSVGEQEWSRLYSQLDTIAEAFGVPFRSIEDVASPARMLVTRAALDGMAFEQEEHVIALSPAPARALNALAENPDGVDARLAATSDLEAEARGQLIVLKTAGPERLVRREHIMRSNGLVVAVSEADRDGRQRVTLSGSVAPSKAAQMAVWAQEHHDADLVGWEPEAGRATIQKLSPEARAIRHRIAKLYKLEPHLLGVEVTEAAGTGHFERIVIRNAPDLDKDPTKRRDAWAQAVLSLPGGTNGCQIREDAAESTITITWGPERQLPRTVPGRSLLPDRVDGTRWQSLAFGLTERGTPACVDLKAGPHSLVVGGTGSGKTYATRMLLLAAYASGFEVILIDPTKRAAGLRDMDPYAKVVATKSKRQAADVISAVYREVARRVDLTEQYAVEDWRGLPKSLGVRPWFVVVDEYAGLVAPKLQKPLDKSSDEYAEWEDESAAIDTIRGRMSNLAAEARSAGIHLCIVTQSAYADILSGQMRLNLGTIIQLVPPSRPPARSHLGMVFDAADVEAAEATIRVLNDGRSPGFAVSAIDGVGVQGVRVGLIVNEKPDPDEGGQHIQEDLEYLRELGVPLGVPLSLGGESDAAKPQFGRIIDGSRAVSLPIAAEDEVVDVGLVDIDFGGMFDGPTTADDPWSAAATARAQGVSDAVADAEDLFGPIRTNALNRRTHVDEGFGASAAVVPEEDRF